MNKCTLFLLFLCLLANGCSSLRLSESNASIREQIIKITPLGTEINEAEKLIKLKIRPQTFYIDFPAPNLPAMGVIGKPGVFIQDQWPLGIVPQGKSIGCQIGQNGIWKNVCAYWGFDSNERLMDVFVYKNSNTP